MSMLKICKSKLEWMPQKQIGVMQKTASIHHLEQNKKKANDSSSRNIPY